MREGRQKEEVAAEVIIQRLKEQLEEGGIGSGGGENNILCEPLVLREW
jgi:hypothetical protein